MAVMQNSIIFGGVDSADFGIYIGGEGTFDAPKRDVEMISIPGRNGAFALDKGRFQNIEVTYSAFNHEPDLATFSAQLEGFRNAICSQKGYQRLTDTFHPDEYRMAAYIDGLEIKPIEYNTAATFDIVFDCKPQRFLTSGEEAIDVDSGDTITNPTLFESSPLLMINGSGEVTINDYEPIRIMGGELGPYIAASGKTTSQTLTETFDFDDSLLNNGDSIGPLTGEIRAQYYPWRNGTEDFEASQSGDAGTIICKKYSWYSQRSYSGCYVKCEVNTSPFTYGTSRTDTTSFSGTVPTSTEGSLSISAVCTITYDGAKTITMSLSVTRGEPTKLLHFASGDYVKREALYANSSQSILGNPLYIDLDIGEAYKIENDKVVSINEGVVIPATLPTLSSGANTITTDNITELQVVPRWWKI